MTSSETAVPGNAADIQLRAAEWIMEQNEDGRWSEGRQSELDTWLAKDPAHLLAYWRLKAAWERTHRLAALQIAPLDARRNTPAKSNRPLMFRLLAATAVVAVAGGWLLLRAPEASEKTYATSVGGHEIVSLADGSRIELNTGTEIRVRPQGRTVELVRGEAFFQIRHDSLKPFTVLAQGHRVTDLGTKFLMRADGKKLTVTLLDGSVRFESDGAQARSHSEVLEPGDVAIATANSVSVTQRAPQALVDASAWRKGMLVFRDQALAQAISEFNRYNREQMVVEGARASNVKIDGTFRADNVTGFTNMVEHVLDLKVRKHGQQIAISE